MSSEERLEFNRMKSELDAIKKVLDISFIEEAKRKIVTPETIKMIKFSDLGDTTGVLKGVSEGGSSSYDVADAFDGTVIITLPDGNTYKLGYYS